MPSNIGLLALGIHMIACVLMLQPWKICVASLGTANHLDVSLDALCERKRFLYNCDNRQVIRLHNAMALIANITEDVFHFMRNPWQLVLQS